MLALFSAASTSAQGVDAENSTNSRCVRHTVAGAAERMRSTASACVMMKDSDVAVRRQGGEGQDITTFGGDVGCYGSKSETAVMRHRCFFTRVFLEPPSSTGSMWDLSCTCVRMRTGTRVCAWTCASPAGTTVVRLDLTPARIASGPLKSHSHCAIIQSPFEFCITLLLVSITKPQSLCTAAVPQL